jgi:hypothetical protein
MRYSFIQSKAGAQSCRKASQSSTQQSGSIHNQVLLGANSQTWSTAENPRVLPARVKPAQLLLSASNVSTA